MLLRTQEGNECWRSEDPPSASNPLCVCIIGSYTLLPSSVLIIDDLFFLSVFFSFHYPLSHYFCQIKRIISAAQSRVKTSFPIISPATAWNQILQFQWSMDETVFEIFPLLWFMFYGLARGFTFIFNSTNYMNMNLTKLVVQTTSNNTADAWGKV